MSTTTLKLLSLIIMTIDHIAEFNLDCPEWFHWIGRISAPIFLFCCTIGFSHTRNRKVYLLRMYLLSVGMSVVNAIINTYFPADYIMIDNNIFSTLFASCFLIFLIDIWLVDKRNGSVYLLLYVLEQIIGMIISRKLDFSDHETLCSISCSVFANVFFNEGGILFVLCGILLYYSRNIKWKVCMSYLGFSLVYILFYVTNALPYFLLKLEHIGDGTLYEIFRFLMSLCKVMWIPSYGMRWFTFTNYYWMVIFALPFLLLYNGKKGKGLKYLFYVYYPVHIYVLYFLFR